MKRVGDNADEAEKTRSGNRPNGKRSRKENLADMGETNRGNQKEVLGG